MFKVAPNGITKLVTLWEIPRFSQQAIVNGNVAEELAVPKATIIASAIAAYNIHTGTLENILKNNGNTIRGSIRSRGPIINEVAASFGGGGHIYASGVRLKDFDEVDNIVLALDETCKNYQKTK